MVIDAIDRFGEIGKGGVEDPYIPFFPAHQSGLVASPEDLAVEPKNPIGIDIANGLIPNAEGKGIVSLGRRIIAVDHVRIRRRGSDKRLIISPTSKSDVKP